MPLELRLKRDDEISQDCLTPLVRLDSGGMGLVCTEASNSLSSQAYRSPTVSLTRCIEGGSDIETQQFFHLQEFVGVQPIGKS